MRVITTSTSFLKNEGEDDSDCIKATAAVLRYYLYTYAYLYIHMSITMGMYVEYICVHAFIYNVNYFKE
jgi:hypothetical protein